LQVGSDMTVSLSSNDKTVDEQLAFFQGNIQINPGKDDLYTLKEGNYDIRNLAEVRLSNLEDIDDFSITVSEFKGSFNSTENFRRNKMVLSFEESTDPINVSGTLNFKFKSSTRDRILTFDDIKRQLILKNTDSTAGSDGSTLNINGYFSYIIITDTPELSFSELISGRNNIDLNKSSLGLSMNNARTFDLSLFGKIMTLPKDAQVEF